MDTITFFGIWFFGGAFTFGYRSTRYPDEEAFEIMIVSMLWPVIVLGAIPGMLGAALADTLKRRGGK